MNHEGPVTTKDLPTPKARLPLARSLRTSRPFIIAVFFSGLHYLGLITTISAFILCFMQPSQLAMQVILGSMVFSAVTWLVAFFKRRSAYCPLCMGTPLVNSGAFPHARATRVFPFNHGVTATLSIIATQTFRCMYCGSDFDLLKIPSHLRGAKNDDDAV